MNNSRPVCKNKNNLSCFGYANGLCNILTDTNFKNHDCPFRKTKEQIAVENDKGRIRRDSL